DGLAVRHLGAVHDGRVVELVEEHDVATPHEARDQAEVRLVPRREDEAGFLAEELRQLGLELLVQVERAVQEAAAGAARAVALERGLSRGEPFRMMRESEV